MFLGKSVLKLCSKFPEKHLFLCMICCTRLLLLDDWYFDTISTALLPILHKKMFIVQPFVGKISVILRGNSRKQQKVTLPLLPDLCFY